MPPEPEAAESWAGHALKRLDVSPATRAILEQIRAEVDAAYRDRLLEMAQAINRQAAALDRIQLTLQRLVEAVSPQLIGNLPPAIRVAPADEAPDLASTLVVADPLGAGYTLTQKNVADVVGITAPDASVLLRALGLDRDGSLAVRVRTGEREVVNYRPAVAERLRQLIEQPPEGLSKAVQSCLRRVRHRLGA